MPRYRFAWVNVPGFVLEAVAAAQGMQGDPAESLKAVYGARPKVVFVADNWPVLLSDWLPRDDDSRKWIVEQLMAKGLGNADVAVEDAQGQLDYLRSCRAASTLRETVLSAFHAVGEPGYAVTAPVARHDEETERAPDSPETLDADGIREFLTAVFTEAGFDPTPDSGGDYYIARGSAMTFIRVPQDSPILSVFSPLVRGMQPDPAIYEAVNTINLQLPIGAAVVVEDGTAVVLNYSFAAESLTPTELWSAIDAVSAAADAFDSLLVERFGGSTFLPYDDADAVDV